MSRELLNLAESMERVADMLERDGKTAAPSLIRQFATQVAALSDAAREGAGVDWRELLDAVVSQFDDPGCTCTFQDDSCCAYARAVAALEKSA